MDMKRVTLALAAAAIAGSVTGDLRAQEFDLPPVPSSATEKGGKAFTAENGPCFYNPYRWVVRGAVNQTLIASELQDLATGGTSAGSGCLGHYAVTGSDLFGPWAYMLIDGVRRPERVSQERVKAVWDASRKAAAEAEGLRLGHVKVPTIGNGHGSDEALIGRTLVFRAAPAPTPATYNGIPIVERDRSWERFETADGQRVWRVVEPNREAYGRRPGDRGAANERARAGTSRADGGIQKQVGIRSASGSVDRSPGAFRGSSSSSSSASSSSSSESASPAPRGKKAVKQ